LFLQDSENYVKCGWPDSLVVRPFLVEKEEKNCANADGLLFHLFITTSFKAHVSYDIVSCVERLD
jgi:hypothetical protein